MGYSLRVNGGQLALGGDRGLARGERGSCVARDGHIALNALADDELVRELAFVGPGQHFVILRVSFFFARVLELLLQVGERAVSVELVRERVVYM